MSRGWTVDQLELVDAADELRIAVARADGTFRRPVPIWAVTVDGEVYARTWHRRDTGWYGRVLVSCRARIAVPGAEVVVEVADVSTQPDSTGAAPPRAAVDAAYRAKYGRYGAATVARMVGDDAAATTLRFTPEGP